jgi:hypothetical protein
MHHPCEDNLVRPLTPVRSCQKLIPVRMTGTALLRVTGITLVNMCAAEQPGLGGYTSMATAFQPARSYVSLVLADVAMLVPQLEITTHIYLGEIGRAHVEQGRHTLAPRWSQ